MTAAYNDDIEPRLHFEILRTSAFTRVFMCKRSVLAAARAAVKIARVFHVKHCAAFDPHPEGEP